MSATIVVDANVILSALLGGKPGVILFDGRFQFVTTAHTLNEVRKYIPKLARKLSLPDDHVYDLLAALPVFVYADSWYQFGVAEAERMIGHIDTKDMPVLALALCLGVPLWAQDKHFEKSGYAKILKTENFFK